MATKLPRLNITFPDNIMTMIKRDALAQERSFSNQVIWILRQHYVTKKMEAELFTPSQLSEEVRTKVPVFRMKDEPDESAPSKRQEHPDRQSS